MVSETSDHIRCYLSDSKDPGEEKELGDARALVHTRLIDVDECNASDTSLEGHNENSHAKQNTWVESDVDENHDKH